MAKQPTGYSEEELSLLSDEERAGLEDEDLLDDPIAGAEAEAAAAAEAVVEKKEPPKAEENPAEKSAEELAAQDEDNDDAAKNAAPVADNAAAEAAKAAEAEAAAAAPVKEEPEAAKPKAPTWSPPSWEAPENAQARLDEIEKQKDDLHQKFDDGDLTSRELREQLKPLDRAAQAIRDETFKASYSQDWQKSNYLQNTVPQFLAAHTEYADSPLFDALDMEVKRLQAKDPSRAFDPAMLEEAHTTVRNKTLKALGIDPDTVGAKAETKTPAKKAEPPVERKIPPSLAGLPASDLTEPGTVSKFAFIDKLEGEAYEAAIAKLSDAEMNQYLQDSG